MGDIDFDNPNEELDLKARLAQLERENRRLNRSIVHLKNAISQEKIAYTTTLNQERARTFSQRERDKYLALLLANSPSIILFLSQTWRVEFCTEYFVAKAGYKNVSDVLGHTLTEVLSPFLDSASHEELLMQSKNVIQTNAPIAFDVAFRFNRDGEAEDFAGLLVPMKDEQRHSDGIMLLLHDVTDLKRTREEALEASKAKSAFLSNMSHEIRTPMNAIIGMTSIGKREKDLARKDSAFEKIESASEHLLGVINDILDISKIESGKMELSNITFSFSQMLERVMSVITLKMQEKRHHFKVDIDREIPETLFGDDQRLAQVITNVLSNATKFTPEDGTITFTAELASIQEGTCVVQMCVKDSGIGMTKQQQAKLFNIFQQAEAGTARKYGGSGLGLAISKRILEQMGGDIWVESEPGKGSSFFFRVSLGIPADGEAAADIGQRTDEEYTRDCDFSGKTVLLVDDIEINLEILVALLEPTKITAVMVQSGREAVSAFAAQPERYDLILMDMQMPEIDGLEATRLIRALDTPWAAKVPIIAMTANVFKEDIQKCVDAGMDGHLGKPIDMKDVLRTLTQYLGS